MPYSPTTAHNHLCPASPLHDVFPPPQFRRERCYLSAKLAPHLTHQHVSATQISRSNASAHTRYLLTIAFHPYLRPSHSIDTAPWGGVSFTLSPPWGAPPLVHPRKSNDSIWSTWRRMMDLTRFDQDLLNGLGVKPGGCMVSTRDHGVLMTSNLRVPPSY